MEGIATTPLHGRDCNLLIYFRHRKGGGDSHESLKICTTKLVALHRSIGEPSKSITFLADTCAQAFSPLGLLSINKYVYNGLNQMILKEKNIL